MEDHLWNNSECRGFPHVHYEDGAQILSDEEVVRIPFIGFTIFTIIGGSDRPLLVSPGFEKGNAHRFVSRGVSVKIRVSFK